MAGAFSVDDAADTLLSPASMDWRNLLFTVLRGVVRFVANEYYPACGCKGKHKAKSRPRKEAPPPPRAEEPVHSAGWGPPTEAAPVTVIRVETDAGSTVAVASFIGEECFGVTRVEKERRPGESRRTRRKPPVPQAGASYSMSDPTFAARVKAMRDWANAAYARQQAEYRRTEGTLVARQPAQPASQAPMIEDPSRASRARAAGVPLSISWLAPETLILLADGEPLTFTRKAA